MENHKRDQERTALLISRIQELTTIITNEISSIDLSDHNNREQLSIFYNDLLQVIENTNNLTIHVLNNTNDIEKMEDKLDVLVKKIFINSINLLDAFSYTWHKKEIEHLNSGFSILAANTYTLYGVTISNDNPLPQSIENFPKRI